MGNDITRGVRNNNPGNIDRNPANKWQGRAERSAMTQAQHEESRFEVFASPAWGIRAMAVLLIHYFDGTPSCDTVRAIINRWAPSAENNTTAYVGAVANAMSVAPDDRLYLHQFSHLQPLVQAIIAHENAGYRYPPEIVEEGLRLAGVVKPASALIAPAPTVHPAAALAAAAGGTAAIGEVAQQVQAAISPMLPAISQVSTVNQTTAGMPPALRAAISLVVLVAAAASLYAWWRLRRARQAASMAMPPPSAAPAPESVWVAAPADEVVDPAPVAAAAPAQAASNPQTGA
jgi:hypothetical protein